MSNIHSILSDPQLIEAGIAENRLYESGAFPEARARHVFHQLLEAVRYLHARNIVHRVFVGVPGSGN